MKGILFKPWKIKAIAANPDKEWQTRRVIKSQPERGVICKCPGDDISFSNFEMYLDAHKTGGWIPIGECLKPRYHVGEVVYIKESWRYFGGKEYEYLREPKCVIYRNDVLVNLDIYEWNNPRTMPAWTARYFIKITRVEACRTKDITPEDCRDEGIERQEDSGHNIFWFEPIDDYHGNFQQALPQQAYFALYDSINGKGAHEHNWDWKYTFVKVDKPEIPHSPDVRKGTKE